jgi:hypothetical protein
MGAGFSEESTESTFKIDLKTFKMKAVCSSEMLDYISFQKALFMLWLLCMPVEEVEILPRW